ncbi:MAG: valine--pyruvate transaminase [Victivallales bacterium]|nr:valine--pyruvate transaminase [Victivallales bacterium]
MELSTFGRRFSAQAGILTLMDDLGAALATGNQIMLGGGNPAYIPAIQQRCRERMQQLLADGNAFERLIGDYCSPAGPRRFRQAVAELLRREYGWPLTADNIALTNGSQSAFFYLFNSFAGRYDNGRMKKILLPLAPEYIGYADVGIDGEIFTSNRPRIEFPGNGRFKYHVDFDQLKIDTDIGAICVSRPTNPTGNVLTDNEINRLSQLAAAHHIPLIIDNAYGTPFPNIIFTAATPIWNENIVLSLSLSKFGLPGTRCGIVVAREEIIRVMGGMNAIFNLSPTALGAALAEEMMRSGEIIELSRREIRPFYQAKAERACQTLAHLLRGTDCFIHVPEGAIFLWLWMRDLPISAAELYRRLKERRVVVVPGHYFFPGLPAGWRHCQECIRITFAPDDQTVAAGLRIIAEEVINAYREG